MPYVMDQVSARTCMLAGGQTDHCWKIDMVTGSDDLSCATAPQNGSTAQGRRAEF